MAIVFLSIGITPCSKDMTNRGKSALHPRFGPHDESNRDAEQERGQGDLANGAVIAGAGPAAFASLRPAAIPSIQQTPLLNRENNPTPVPTEHFRVLHISQSTNVFTK